MKSLGHALVYTDANSVYKKANNDWQELLTHGRIWIEQFHSFSAAREITWSLNATPTCPVAVPSDRNTSNVSVSAKEASLGMI